MKLPTNAKRERATEKREAEFRIDGRLVDCADEAVNKRKSRNATFPRVIIDDMLAYLIQRAGVLTTQVDNPDAKAELECIVDLIEAYKVWRSKTILASEVPS